MLYERIRSRLFQMDPEDAHDRAARCLCELGNIPFLPAILRGALSVRSERLRQTLFGLTFENPVGLAAGMDKTGEAVLGWRCFGFGFLEVGGFTRFPQKGNGKPRLFRAAQDRALINRMGFNNPGAEKVAVTLEAVAAVMPEPPLFINIGKSKDVPLEDAPGDYAQTFGRLYPYGDAFVINVSSPNTPGLRELQGKTHLKEILRAIREKALRHPHPLGQNMELKPVLVKISPDLYGTELDEVLEAVTEENASGIVATNTTTSREGLFETTGEAGGLSGPPLFGRAVAMVRYIHERLPELPIIGVGGISSEEAALDMLLAGANLIQLCTGLVYEGPFLVRRINKNLVRWLAFRKETISSLHPSVKRD